MLKQGYTGVAHGTLHRTDTLVSEDILENNSYVVVATCGCVLLRCEVQHIKQSLFVTSFIRGKLA